MIKRKLLLVDDDPRMAPAISTVLGDQYEIIAVGMAKDAIAYLFKNPVHAALLDIGLPDIDGLDLLNPVISSSGRVIVRVDNKKPWKTALFA